MKKALPVAVLAAVLFSVVATLISCGPASTAPEKGTPAFYWAAAKETWMASDYMKTLEHLDKIVYTENEYTKRAQPWILILTSGLSRGYAELAEHYELGARANRADPSPFRKQMSLNRAMAGKLALQFAENLSKFQTAKDANVSLEFPFPTGSAAPVPQLTKVAKGMSLPPAEAEQVQQRDLQRGIMLELCRAVGVGEDTAKVQEMFKSAPVNVPRPVFLLGMATTLHDEAQLYDGRKLDDPSKMKLFCERAQDVVKSLPESKQSKDLSTKIQATLKKTKTS